MAQEDDGEAPVSPSHGRYNCNMCQYYVMQDEAGDGVRIKQVRDGKSKESDSKIV